MIKIALCDDEKQQRSIIKQYIHNTVKMQVDEYEILEYHSGDNLLKNYPMNMDILILDIQMDKLNGMETARRIREFDNNVEIIFITGLWEYVQQGYEVRAYRYLIKPVEYSDFKKQFELCVSEILKYKKNNIIVGYKGESNKISINDIFYVETEGRNTIIHTEKDSYKSNLGINKIEKELDRNIFFRSHNSFLINLQHLTKIKQSSVSLGEVDIPVSRHRLKELKLQFTRILGDKL
ncbi:MAG: LytR/AlgR family response regulator transcription factor [Paraclostridium sp.]